jgi:hypothetical protein
LNIYCVFFALLGVATFVAFGIAIWQDTHPEWVKYQKAYYEGKYEDAKIKYEQAVNEREKARWKKRMNALKNPEYQLKQILLDSGKHVDRCTTCHLDEASLKKTHPRSKEFPFRKFGCTVCHGGDGRATTFKKAHAGIQIDRKTKVQKYLVLRTHSVTAGENLDLVNFWTTGEQIKYVGSKVCIKCHISRNRRHVERWKKAKFNTFDRIKEGLTKFDQRRQSLILLTVSKRGSRSLISWRASPLRQDPLNSSATPAIQPDTIMRRMNLRRRGLPARPATAQAKYTPNSWQAKEQRKGSRSLGQTSWKPLWKRAAADATRLQCTIC